MKRTFAEVSRQIFVIEKKFPRRNCASAGMEYATLFSHVTGQTTRIRDRKIDALLFEVRDVRLIDALLRDAAYVAVGSVPQTGRETHKP